jgi:tetratricopeptide (TPR) repeat protein
MRADGAIGAARPISMIANRIEAEPAGPIRAGGTANNSGRGVRLAGRLSLVLFTAAAIAGVSPFASFGRAQNSSAAGLQADRQQELARVSQAAKDVDVGTFYMHKGDYGAAISRLKEAVQIDPNYAKARLLLAESYQKQGDRTHALETYQEYLKAFPNSRDDKKIRKKIADLQRKRD